MHASNFGCTTCTSCFITLSSLLYDLPTHWSQSEVKTTSASFGIPGDSKGLFWGCPIYLCTDFRGGAKNQPMPWQGRTG